jgi:capsular polysaccharide biosynthesis protein
MTPQRATRPNTILNVITGLVVGLILSTLLALLIQYVHADVRLAGRSS